MKKRIFTIAIALITMLCGMLCTGCKASFYSDAQHMSRVKSLAEQRFLKEDSEYTGMEVYPLYTENDEVGYFLIELEPQGFMYVNINYYYSPVFSMFSGVGMYLMSDTDPVGWSPYRMIENGYGGTKEEYFLDENGDEIKYFESHFKVAKIKDERRYLLATPMYSDSDSTALIPAVKRGEQYLDLVDGALIDYQPGVYSKNYACAISGFIPKSSFNL